MWTWIKEFLGIYKKPNNVVEAAPVAGCPFKEELPASLPEIKVETSVVPEPVSNVQPEVKVEVQLEEKVETQPEIKVETAEVVKVESKAEKPKTQQKARKPRKKNGASS